MNDLERDVRTVLERDAERAPFVTGPPQQLRSRVRRRQIATATLGVGLTAALIGSAVIGIGAIADGDRQTPAEPQPPDATPVVVERGSAQGWDWVLSRSEDGSCVALTDAQGSTTLCPTQEEIAALGDGEVDDIVGVTVRSPRPPGPAMVFVFGIVSTDVTTVQVLTTAFVEAQDLMFVPAASGDSEGYGYFIGRFDRYPYPVVPEIVTNVVGEDTPGEAAAVELPTWAKPVAELIETTASGTWHPHEAEPRPWTLGVWRDNLQDGALCYPDMDACGPAEDPVPAWNAPWGRLEAVSVNGSWRGDGHGNALVWGVFREPVVSVRVEIEGLEPFEPDFYPPPPDYPDANSLFVFEFEGEAQRLFEGSVVGLDAEGHVVATDDRIA